MLNFKFTLKVPLDVGTVAECDSTPSSWVGVRTYSEKPKCGIPRSIYEEVAKADPSKTRCDFIDSSKYQVTASTRWANAAIREIEKSSRPTPRELQQWNLDPAFQGAPASDKAPR